MSDRLIAYVLETLENKVMEERRKNNIPDFTSFSNERIIALNEAIDLIGDTAEEDIPEDFLW